MPLPDSDPLHAYCSGQSSDLRDHKVAVSSEGGQGRGLKPFELTQMQLDVNSRFYAYSLTNNAAITIA